MPFPFVKVLMVNQNILKNHWIQIVLVALILIPSIYTVVFLGSMWDPYGNSGDLPVAVVNKDKAVEYNDKKLFIIISIKLNILKF